MKLKRDHLIDAVKAEFIGPNPLFINSEGDEILIKDPPTERYLAGVLFPQKQLVEKITDESTEAEILDSETVPETVEMPRASEFQETEEIINLSNGYKQSAMSLTIAVPTSTVLSVDIRYAKYDRFNLDGKNTYFKRFPFSHHFEGIALPTGKTSDTICSIPIPSEPNLLLKVSFRYHILAGQATLYTFSLINGIQNQDPEGHFSYKDCFFQCEISLQTNLGFLPIPETVNDFSDDETNGNELLYRDEHRFASGHGCSATWDEISPNPKTIASTFFPEYEMKSIVPNSLEKEDIHLAMKSMAAPVDKTKTLATLFKLVAAYEEWIKDLKQKTFSDDRHRKTADKNIRSCEEVATRMKTGVDLLKVNEMAFEAFALMNESMLMQQLHSSLNLTPVGHNGIIERPNVIPVIDDESTWNKQGRRGVWRPFQLAFILINIQSIIDPRCSERNLVELIWFPTGGGKTEAYLGLSSFLLWFDRLIDKESSGTLILMRYTLRLLTAQQFERAAALICSCEYMRSKNEIKFGKNRFTIGLWVGGKETPNTMSEANKKFEELYDHHKKEDNVFVMLKCPWCGCQMGLTDTSPVQLVGYARRPAMNRRVKGHFYFSCHNQECDYSNSKNGNGLPLTVIDEEIYANPPTLLLGTVDKFAQLPFLPKASKIFGIENGKLNKPPALIIQDELHLISGPLGSTVGLYETLIQELCARKDENGKVISPKIIASTATISRASEQCSALYARDEGQVKLFPPSGIDAGDTFFGIVDKNQPGRKYVGVFAPGAPLATASIRLYSKLLCATPRIEGIDELLKDAYWTIVGYYNTIRELGQAATWINADIPEYVRFLNRKYGDFYTRLPLNSIELTSRKRSDEITEHLKDLEVTINSHYGDKAKKKYAVDICLATNMISVGVDVQRLALMMVTGMPKTTAEYIQATSRVGRSSDRPGVVFTLFNTVKPRDKSVYENFKGFHSKIYSYVEPTSVTPFSAQLRKRALAAIFVGLARLLSGLETPRNIIQDQEIISDIVGRIMHRVGIVDISEVNNTKSDIQDIIKKWQVQNPDLFERRRGDEIPLIIRNEIGDAKDERSFLLPNSMRNVDDECEGEVINGWEE